jgi:hypothetical protein
MAAAVEKLEGKEEEGRGGRRKGARRQRRRTAAASWSRRAGRFKSHSITSTNKE